MGRLLARVREAEEKLAGLTQALRTAWEEELADARQALDAASVALRRAEAMDEAAKALGREELATRLREVLETLRASEDGARERVTELEAIEATVGARLEASREPPSLPEARQPTPGPAALILEATPAPTRFVAPAPFRETTPAPAEAPAGARTLEATPAPATPPAAPTGEANPSPPPVAAPTFETPPGPAPEGPPAPPPAPSPVLKDLLEKHASLAARIAEVGKAAPKLPRAEAELALREHVALVRLLSERLAAAGEADPDARAAPLLERLADIAREAKLGTVFGLSRSEFADWNRTANEARTRRQALLAARQKAAPRS